MAKVETTSKAARSVVWIKEKGIAAWFNLTKSWSSRLHILYLQRHHVFGWSWSVHFQGEQEALAVFQDKIWASWIMKRKTADTS